MKQLKNRLQNSSRNVWFLLAIILLGFTIRLVAVWLTYGTEDVNSWIAVAETLWNGQNPYVNTHYLRWPPLWMILIYAAKYVSVASALEFTKLVKLPAIVADVGIAVVIFFYFANKYRAVQKGRLYAILYVLNPISILIVAVHGQFDSIPVLFLLLSLYVLQTRKSEVDVFVAAIFLGLAVFSKTWPLLLLPLFILHVPGRKAKMTFTSVVLLPLLVSLTTLYVLAPTDIYQKVVRYAGITGWWGFTSFVHIAPGSITEYISDFYTTNGNLLLLLAVGAFYIYCFRRNQRLHIDLLEGVVAALLLIFFLLPGYGTQYMVWLLPFIMIYSYKNRLAWLFLILVALDILIEYIFRPYNGMLGEWILKPHQLRSERFFAAYASPDDITITNLLRLPIWLFCGAFFLSILKGWRVSEVAAEGE